MRLLALLAFLAACDKNDDCKRAAKHLLDITMSGGKVSSEEQQVRAMIEKSSIARCRDEGLHAEARDCIMAMKTVDDLMKLGDCPGIVKHRPSWVLAGPSNPLEPSPTTP